MILPSDPHTHMRVHDLVSSLSVLPSFWLPQAMVMPPLGANRAFAGELRPESSTEPRSPPASSTCATGTAMVI